MIKICLTFLPILLVLLTTFGNISGFYDKSHELMEQTGINYTVSRIFTGCIVFRRWQFPEETNDTSLKYLILRAAHNKYYGWVFPKGRVHEDLGLGSKRLASRILKMKVGLDYSDVKFVEGFYLVKQFKYRGYLKNCTYYLAELKTYIPHLNRRLPWFYRRYKWMPYEGLMQFLPYDDQREILTYCHNYLKINNVTGIPYSVYANKDY